MLAVWADAKRVNVVVVAVLELLLRLPLYVYIEDLRLGHEDLLTLDFCWLNISISARPDLPKLDYLIVCTKKFQPRASRGVKERQAVYLFGQLYTLQVIKLRLVWLKLRKIAIVKVSWALQLDMVKYNYSAALVSHCKMHALSVKGYSWECVCVGRVFNVPLAKAINVHPGKGLVFAWDLAARAII